MIVAIVVVVVVVFIVIAFGIGLCYAEDCEECRVEWWHQLMGAITW